MLTEIITQSTRTTAATAAPAPSDHAIWVAVGIVLMIVIVGAVLKNPWAVVAVFFTVLLTLALFGGYELISALQAATGSPGGTH